MRILYCIPTLGCGGAERQLSYLAAEMKHRGHEVHVAYARNGENYERLAAAGVEMHDLEGRGKHDVRIVPKLVRLVRRIRPDVMQTTLARMDVAGGLAALLTRTPWVLREGSSAPGHPRNVINTMRKIIAPGAAAIVSNSRYGDSYWRARDPRRRHVIRNGSVMPPEDAGSLAMTRSVLFAGRLDEGKNVEVLIFALRLVDDVTAIIAGDGPRRAELESHAVTGGVADRITFTGTVPNILEMMKSSGVVVSLSRYEGCPNVVLEAMACGRPLVLSDIPAHRELLDDRGAWFVAPGDIGAAAAAIREALRSGQERGAIARAAAAQCSIEAMAARYEAVYDAVRVREHVVEAVVET